MRPDRRCGRPRAPEEAGRFIRAVVVVVAGLAPQLLPVGGLAQHQERWQQEVTYRVRASLDEPTRLLRGEQSVLYRNRSPDTLASVVLQLDLNAFRPGSRWVAADSAAGLHRYDTLGDSASGFHRVQNARAGGVQLTPRWPFAPDSTLVVYELPERIPPGDSVRITLSWVARAPARSVTMNDPRSFDLSHALPRMAAYDRHGWSMRPFLPPGRTAGDFGTFLVELDVPVDQVIAATGVPLCGDPGWTHARRAPSTSVTHARESYPAPRDPKAAGLRYRSDGCSAPAPGRKTVIWYAEDVTHFGLLVDPRYRYEEGDIFELPIRALYTPEDERTWGAGLVTGRVETSLAWLAELLGPYPWPQLTSVHSRLESANDHPMMVQSVEPSLATAIHDVGRIHFGGVLANDPWTETWLGEGPTHFQRTWFFETQGVRGEYEALERQVLDWELDGLAEPLSQPADEFRDMGTHQAMTRSRAELFFHQLRELIGEEAMRGFLRTYYRNGLGRRVDESLLLEIADASAGRSLGGFFDQWLRSTPLYDYAVADADRQMLPDGRWRTAVEVERMTSADFPVEVWVFAEGDTVITRTSGSGAREVVEIETATRPRGVLIDPRGRSHDWNTLNNQKTFGFRKSILLLQPDRPQDHYLDTYFSRRTRRDRLTVGWAPLAWYNDAGGWTFGMRSRDDYLGRYELHSVAVTQSTGLGTTDGRTDFDVRVTLRNPTALRSPQLGQRLDFAWSEGRVAAAARVDKDLRRSVSDPHERTVGLSVAWLSTRAPAYLDPGYYDDAGTVELTGAFAFRGPKGSWDLSLDGGLAAGWMYRDSVATGVDRRREQPYGRVTVAATARRSVGGPMSIAARAYGGVTIAPDDLVRQRLIYVAGADPYQRYGNPFLRSRGSILARDGVFYHQPGGAGVRGVDPRTAARQAYGLSLEFENRLWWGGAGLFGRGALAFFLDVALADGDLDDSGNRLRGVGDGGVGLRIDHRIGQTPFQTRFDFPFWVSHPTLAHDDGPGDREFGVRWSFSFVPAF
jgi:hypothetical protein